MEQYVIKGGNPLVGEVDIAGAKNAALAILSAAIMTDETILIENLPDVRDINVLLEAISEIGAQVERIDKSTVKINGSTIGNLSVDYEFIKKIRASYYLLGALLGKYKHAEVPLPGGCNIGSRPIDQHLKGFRALGADVDICHGAIVAKAENLHGSHIFLDVVSVGATINIMMAASMATGRTIIENAAREPHVVDVANFLNSMGANIKGAGTDVIRIRGVETLHRTEYSIIPDQIEAGTFMFAAAATRGDVTVRNVIPKHLEATTAKLEEIGCEVEEFDDAVRVRAPHVLHRTHVKTLPYPGYPTDMQPQIAVTLALAEGTSIVTESIFENRFKYADELSRMGANIKVEGNSAIIDGVRKLTGARVSAPDLRAGAALVIAGLAAEGVTVVDDIVYIQRGYENFEEKLRSLGAEIERVSSEKEIQSKAGCGVTIKHFACNNQEDNRMGVDVHLSERALREIYCRGFEIAIKESKPVAIMSSYNLVNGVHAANSKDLCTRIVRDEWGFEGVIMSDWNTTEPKDGSIPWKCTAAGNDIIMPGSENDHKSILDGYRSGELSEEEIRICARRVLKLIDKLRSSYLVMSK